MRRRLPKLLLAWVLLAAGSVWACRYSVRDTGFVDLGAEPYRLEFSGDEPLATAYRQAAAGLLVDANIAFSAVPPDPAVPPALRLRDGSGRRLELASDFDLPGTPAEITRRVEEAVVSRAREEILRETLRSFAVVVLADGTDPDATGRAADAVRRAIEAVARLQPAMPKPVDLPAHLVRIPVADQPAERVLLWGLGLDPAPSSEPRVAVVYGRGRRLGAPLEGSLITRTALQERLALIGQDCECDLDRAWMQGPVLPGRWDAELQQIASRTLGFDPENPMVRTEVGRIVLRGEGDHQRRRPAGSALALGYAEESIDPEPGLEAAGDPGAGTAPAGEPGERDAADPGADTPAAPALQSRDAGTPAGEDVPDRRVRRMWAAVAVVLGGAAAGGVWLMLRGGGRG